jgi:ABC-2 type transport system ATP-binding protein
MSNILEVRGLRKKYEAFTLNDVSFALPSGSIMGFIGPNGAGKTTTIKLILGAEQCDSGRVSLFGREDGPSQNEKIGIVLDAPPYVEEWRILDIEKAVSPFYKHWDRGAFWSYLKRFDLNPKKKVKELSRGMKVKLQIAVALSHDAELLMLDEPTSGLDPVGRDEICDLVREFVSDESKGVLFSTHVTSDLEKIADHITFILNGKIAFTGTKDALLEKYARVAGGLGDLDEEQRKLVIGYRQHGTGFEGMIEITDKDRLPKNLLIEGITLDEIIIFMNKGAKSNG